MSEQESDVAATTLPEMRELLHDLHYEISNQGSTTMSDLCDRAEATLTWLLNEYLAVRS